MPIRMWATDMKNTGERILTFLVLTVTWDLTLICLNIGTPKHINFSCGSNGKLMVIGVPILKHIRVCNNTASRSA